MLKLAKLEQMEVINMSNLDEKIVELYTKMKLKDLAELLGISVSSLKSKARKLGVKKYSSSPWSEQEIIFLRENFPTKGGKWCSERLDRGFHATHKMAAKLGIEMKHVYESVSRHGYIVDTSDRNNKILKHRKVMEEHLGRKLTSDEIIHHINGDKLDNRIENLEITTRSEHIKMHIKELQSARNSSKI